jgi:serine protease Do
MSHGWEEVMQMKHRRSLVVMALVAGGVAVLLGGKMLKAASMTAEMGQQMVAAAMGGSGGYSSNHGRQGYLGVETRDLNDDELATLKLKDLRGVEIVNLDHDGPACKAGMRMHDVILQVNGQVVDGEEQMRRMLKELQAGRTVSFVITREGQNQTLTLQMADRTTLGLQAWEQHYSVPAPGETSGGGYVPRGNSFLGGGGSAASVTQTPKGHRDFLGTSMILSSSFTGAKLEVMGTQLAEFFGAEGGAGLLVRSVDGNSPAEMAGLKAGDVVVRINSVALSNGADWTKTVHDNRGRPVPVVVLRDKKEQTLTLTPDGKKRSSLIMGLGLEGFFQQTGEQTRELLAKL